MASKRVRAITAGSIAVVLLLGSGCGGDTTSMPRSSLQTTPMAVATTLPSGAATTTTTTTTTSTPLPATTTTTTTLAAGNGVPETTPTIPDGEGVPETFVVHFEESYVCQLGPAGESEIQASGAVAVSSDDSQIEETVIGEDDIDVTGYVRGGDICTGEAVGTHRVRLNGTIEVETLGTRTLTLNVLGTWYDTWDGEITCTGGLPLSGPWQWPPESNKEKIVLPLEDGATWEKEVLMGQCRGTVTRTIEL